MITEISKMQKDDLLFQLKLYRLVPNNQIVRIINERIKDIQDFRQKAIKLINEKPQPNQAN